MQNKFSEAFKKNHFCKKTSKHIRERYVENALQGKISHENSGRLNVRLHRTHFSKNIVWRNKMSGAIRIKSVWEKNLNTLKGFAFFKQLWTKMLRFEMQANGWCKYMCFLKYNGWETEISSTFKKKVPHKNLETRLGFRSSKSPQGKHFSLKNRQMQGIFSGAFPDKQKIKIKHSSAIENELFFKTFKGVWALNFQKSAWAKNYTLKIWGMRGILSGIFTTQRLQ